LIAFSEMGVILMKMNNNTVTLIGHYGSDELIACSAWTSISRNLTEEKRNRIPQMIKRLWDDGHETCFEKGIVHFLVDTEIASHIHLLKHRISSMNAESARYKELKENKYYIPQDWNGIYPSQDIGPDKDFPWATTQQSWSDILEEYTKIGNDLYHQCLKDLEPTLGRKRAKESARFFKTYNSQIQADISFNMRSFANVLKLRNSDHAQKEIREIAQAMVSAVKNIEGNPFQHTLNAWGYE
jgi:thymidylate synthase (FAD)